ncbi:pentapeptide repeat-containing protein [Streptomyces olivochromogenes]|uniref:pentapeptide repeat-containing protein n=1 Tax=Streptomyces olivochromogenes TaxID=1963 RepID=UPI001F3686EB|nr:pentapeptide repeat-containing protein [Streptomyces olivochromogenes]MCF3130828.1 pentapeptide repeat-containing protein [Streptomyces olivochromogenes]
MSDEHPTNKPRPWWRWALITIGIGAFIWFLIWGPWWIEGDHLKDGQGELVSSAGVIVTGFRTMLVAIAAGFTAGVTLYYTSKKHQLEQQQFLHTQEQFSENQKQFEITLREAQQRDERQAELTREGQVTGRYVEAIKLLASDKTHERLGGIFALERIMIDSERDELTIIAVLAAFLRDARRGSDSILPQDVQAAVGVLGRRPTSSHVVDLRGADLRAANLGDLNFARAMFSDANLDGANLAHSDLSGALFVRASLRQTNMTGASLESASFVEATMCGALLAAADLTGATLTADLTGANLRYAILDDVYLSRGEGNAFKAGGLKIHRATLVGADLIGADLRNVKGLPDAEELALAQLNANTQLPEPLSQHPAIQEAVASAPVDADLFPQVAQKIANDMREGRTQRRQP